MGAFRLGKLALLAVLGPFAGRIQLRAHRFVFPDRFWSSHD
jgi:hypothetical protein